MAPYYLAAFCGSTVLAVSVMGGVFSVLPAYEADLYGSKVTSLSIVKPILTLNS